MIDKLKNQKEKSPHANFIIITNGFSKRELNVFKMEKKIKIPILIVPDEKLSFFSKMSKASFPYFFILDEKLEISNVFFVSKQKSVMDDMYFERIIK